MDDMGIPVRILSHWDQTIDTAESVAKELAYSYSLKDCDAEEALAFRTWLAGDTDEMPETMPKSKYVAYCFVNKTNQILCQLSQFSTFPERLCAYAVIDGQVTTVKFLVENMLQCMGVDYTHSFMNNMIDRYQLSRKKIMRMYSAVYVGRKTKLEREFYFGYIQAWVENNKDEYLDTIGGMSGEWRRKILAALRKAELIDM